MTMAFVSLTIVMAAMLLWAITGAVWGARERAHDRALWALAITWSAGAYGFLIGFWWVR